MKTTVASQEGIEKNAVEKTVYPILFSIAFAHLLNDMLQSVIPSVYPIIKDSFNLSFTQIGMITFAYQIAASILQPFVGIYTDKRPQPFSQIFGMLFTTAGIVVLAFAANFHMILVSVILVGIGSSIFHPESSRVSYLASGGKRGLAQSIFQLGGNAGSAIGPLLVALIVVPYGQTHILWFVIISVIGMAILSKVAFWYQSHLTLKKVKKAIELPDLSKNKIIWSVVILLVLIFSKYFYMASMSSYFTFYLIEKFHLSVQDAQFHLFLFLGAVAAGTLIGGPLGDKFGRKYIIWFSILGAAPFTMMLPYADLFWTGVLSVIIGIIIASAFSAILVYAQELLPKNVGMVSGLFFGFAFGMGGLGSALLGNLADHTSIDYVYHLCAYLPLIGVIAIFLPNLKHKKAA
ncbi:MFS transporter [Flavobacterium kingsejongi]|uniref:MFS transporter n=1 Tax=Flavobacterium kingsejongi TaxID=1678728 RepID=A0A2S1LT46_9FLAO|nr:MFS transporter [Flavobacterium kingsejongi]AWG26894.1 MFS transporter [Flavobacterium kingsejongi]